MTFKNGEKVREHWDGRDRWKMFTYERAAEAVSAQVDPERVLLLDVDYTNNSRTLDPRGGAAATKWMLKWMVWLQDLPADRRLLRLTRTAGTYGAERCS